MKKAELRRTDTLRRLRGLGETWYDDMTNGNFPWVTFPSRSIDNIRYDGELKHFVLGDRRVRRSTRNLRHLRPFSQLAWAAHFVHDLMKKSKTSTLRDVFYSAQAYGMKFKDQSESNNIITDLETVISHPREDFNVYPEQRSAIFGDLTIEYTTKGYEGKQINLTIHPDGVMIGPALSTSEFVETSADKVIVVEKGALFTRLVEERAHERFNALVVHTAGQAPRASRALIHRLNDELGLPVYIYTDSDPWGVHIAMVIISGSALAAHIPELATPSAKWAGVWASDIVKYDLPTDPLTNLDIKRLQELRRDPRYGGELWKREIDTFFKIKKKAEQEAFARYGLTYVVDKYIPEKMEIVS
ncbi:MAG: DNA topoisomerase IV subunit A [Candidatus Bathyarchaeia archaeon]